MKNLDSQLNVYPSPKGTHFRIDAECVLFDIFKQSKRHWEKVGMLCNIADSAFMKGGRGEEVGLYKLKMDRVIRYVGVSARFNEGGLKARLVEYLHRHPSVLKYESGRKICSNLKHLECWVLPLGDDVYGALLAKALEGYYIYYHRNTVWNKRSQADIEEESYK